MSHPKKPGKYVAFISYRHLSPDMQIARALHKMLEHNMVRPNRHVPRNIRPVFLDVTELPTVEDLDQGIKDALDTSDCLFVVCSPNLPLSKYCMEEIRYFKARHGGSLDRIYTILVDGDPQDAFPEILRTKTVRSILPDGTEKVEEVAAEPLFADVRGKNIRQSLWKLHKSEYLRLAAAYYRCSYDQLYKRYWRWVGSLAVSAALAIGLTAYGFRLNSQSLMTDAISSHAEQFIRDEDELLALSLCREAELTFSQRYQAALQSAVVQYDYKRHAEPVSPVYLTSFQNDVNSVRYLSASGNRIITKANSMLQITDAKTGAVLLHQPQDQIFVSEENPSTYIRLFSHLNGEGVMCDYVSLCSLEDNSVVSEFSYRTSDRNSSSYRLIQAIETDTLLAVTDGNEYVAFLTSDGEALTREEFLKRGEEYLDVPLQTEEPEYYVSRDKLLKTYVVKDRKQETVLTLGNDVTAYDLSDDLGYFAWMDQRSIYVYDTARWEMIASSNINGEGIQKIHLLKDSTYYLTYTLQDGASVCSVRDWRSGRKLLSFTGMPMFHPEEPCFFVVEKGKIQRYDYRDLDTGTVEQVLHHFQERCIAQGSGKLLMLDTAKGTVLLDTACPSSDSVAWSGDLRHILLHDGGVLQCFDREGCVLWKKNTSALRIAVSEDGAAAAWLDESGNITVADCATGNMLHCVSGEKLLQAGDIRMIAVSGDGLCVSGEAGVLWIPGFTEEPLYLGMYSGIRLFADGLLFLDDQYARVMDFAVYDIHSQSVIYQPESNTGVWVYASESGYLIRHTQTSGNNPTMTAEILKRSKKGFSQEQFVTLPSDTVDRMVTDSTGQWMSILSGGQTQLYRLKDMKKYLDAQCAVYYENRVFYAYDIFGSRQYAIAMQDTDGMLAYAQNALQSESGIRRLTEEDRMKYGIH